MDKTLQYSQVMLNFDSAYNVSPKPIRQSTMYIPMSSSTDFASFSNRSSSPLFRRSISPSHRPPISTGAVPKFNFDLYKMDKNNNEYTGYSSPPYRSISPSSSTIIHHYPTHSPISSPTSQSGTVAKLRQINDELSRTLARSELTNQSSSSSSQPHYHIHHYPLSQPSHRKHRSRSTSADRPRSTEIKVSPKIHKARVTYKIHVPRRHRHRKSPRHTSSSDEYSSNEPVTVDLYPTRDQGFVKQSRQRSDDQSSWLVDGKSLRRNSYSDTRASRPPKGPYYGDKPIKSSRRSNRDKERHRSPYIISRIRPDSAPLDTSDQYHETNGSFSNTTPVWRPSGSVRQPKFIGSHAPPRTDSPSSRARERVWYPPSKTTSERPPKYFEPTLKPEYDGSAGKYLTDGTESEPVSQRKTLSNRTKIRNNDPKPKKRVENSDSKNKSTWEPTVTGFSQSTVKESKPPVPVPVKKTTSSTPPTSKAKSVPLEPTGPPTKPTRESTPKNQNNTHENNDSVENLFENESQTSEPSKRQELPHPPPPIEKTTTPQKPPTELPKTTVPEPDKGTKSTVKNGVLIHGNDPHHPTSSPTSDVHDVQPKSNNESSIDDDDDDRDENDHEVARNFDFHRWLDDASKSILDPSKKGALVIPSTPPQAPLAKPKAKSPPRRKEQPPSPSPDENLYRPPFGPKKTDQKPSKSPPTTKTEKPAELDDFFD